jgi:hypothetical protein
VAPAALFLLLSLAVLAFLPGLVRLAGVLAVTAALLAAAALAGNMKAARERYMSAPARRALRGGLRVAACVAALAAAGALTSLPVINVAAPREAFLPAETLELLGRLDRPVTMTARVSASRSSEGPARHLLGLYAKASPWVSFTLGPAQGSVAPSDYDDLALATQDTVTLSASGFEETVFPITRSQVDAAIRRLVSPPRLVYCLMGEGAKSSMDSGPRGLSAWAAHLARRRIYVRDWDWSGERPLPPEAQALVYAGPRIPPDPAKERELLAYLARGGRLMSLNDPMVAALDPALFAPLSLRLPEGLIYDQTRNWAGTDDAFIVADDFPAHPATLGMREPVIFPLAGAVLTRDLAAGDPGGPDAGSPGVPDAAPPGTPDASGSGVQARSVGNDGGPDAAGTGGPARADGNAARTDASGSPGEAADPAPAAGDSGVADEAGSAGYPDDTPPAAAGSDSTARDGASGRAADPAPASGSAGVADATGSEGAAGDTAPAAAGSDSAAREQASGGAADPAPASVNSAGADTADRGVKPEADDAFLSHSWAVALTSQAAFLETDRASVGRREPRYDRDIDPAGPMVLVSATTLAGGGRLVLAADSDFASNAYIGFAGNLDFATGLVSWLVGEEDDLAGPRQGTVLMLTDSVARLMFWGPVVFWPLVAMAFWGAFFLRRRKASA